MATNTFSAFIHPLLKLPTCFWKQQPRILQLPEALGSFGLHPFRGAGTGFVGVLPLPLILACLPSLALRFQPRPRPFV